MKSLIITILFLTVTNLFSQETITSYKMSNDDFLAQNAHDYAISIIQKEQEYMEEKHKKFKYLFIPYTFEYTSHKSNDEKVIVPIFQSFTVKVDGSIELNNISVQDALLLMVASQADRDMREFQNADKLRDEIMKNDAVNKLPVPKSMVVKKSDWEILNEPVWNKNADGETYCDLHKIKIVKEPTQDKRRVMLHEIMHVATNCANGNNLIIHKVITQIADPLLKILQDNPDLVDYLTKNVDINTDEEIKISSQYMLYIDPYKEYSQENK